MNRQDIKDWLQVMLIVAGLCFIIGLCIYGVLVAFGRMAGL